MATVFEFGKNWVKDENGNRCSVEYFGSEELAQKALDSLENCSGCSDCSDCSGCSGCSGCSDCSDCSRCSGCSGCSGLYLKNNLAPGEVLEPIVIPVIPDIHKAVYAAASNPDALRMDNVHTCANTHCRGGWIVTLAGEAGRKLEEFFNWELAAMLIYDASDPGFQINPARFYDTNEAALADMKRLAEKT